MGAIKNAMLDYCDDVGIPWPTVDECEHGSAFDRGFQAWCSTQVWPYRADGSRNPLWTEMDRPAKPTPRVEPMPLERFDVSLMIIGAVLIGIIGATIAGMIGR